MMNKSIVLCCASCGLFVALALCGCDKQEEPRPETAKVQSFKIEKVVTPVAEAPVQGGDAAVPEGTAPAPEEAPAAAVTDTAAVGAPAEETAASTETPVTEAPAAGDVSVQAGQTEVPLAPPVTVPALALDADDKGGPDQGYNPEGRVDPFEPLFQARQEKTSVGSLKSQTIRDARRGKLTPLEKLDISQLTLTAIIQGRQRNVAMVQESTGKGHVIKNGTYLGINSGRVVEITKNTVVIEEEVEDLLGKIIVRKREMKLQKPLGDM
ncbi:hypothetical protein JCM14469_20450 [Desulfatiferula olefinivorans]